MILSRRPVGNALLCPEIAGDGIVCDQLPYFCSALWASGFLPELCRVMTRVNPIRQPMS